MEKKIFKLAIINIPPLIYLEKDNNNNYIPGGHFYFVVSSMLHLLKKLNTYRLELGSIFFNEITNSALTILSFSLKADIRHSYTVEDATTSEMGVGTELTPGNWSSIVGILQRREADILAGIYNIDPVLYEVVDFTTSFEFLTYVVLSGPPRRLHRQLPSIFSTVPGPVWTLLGSTWIFVSFVYWLMSKIEAEIFGSSEIESSSLASYLLAFYGLLFQKGFENLPATLCRRILAAGWLFLILILTIELGGALSSKLAVEDKPERIEKIQDILKYPDLVPYVGRGTCGDTFFLNHPDKEMRAVWDQVQRHDGLCLYNDFFQSWFTDKISEGLSVVIGSVQAHLNPLVDVACRLKVRPFHFSKEVFDATPMAGMVRKGFDPQLLEAFSLMFTQFGGMGFHQEFWRSMRKHSAPCLEYPASLVSYTPTALGGLGGVFKILAVGLLVSTFLLFAELLYETLNKVCPRIHR